MLKVAVLGAGWVTTNRHIPALKKSKRCEVIGIIDKRAERAEEAAKKCSLPHFGNDLDADWLKEATAVTVGVSPMAHFDVVDNLLDRGKHVLMEKPMCLSVAEAESLVDKATAKGLTLAIVHNFQFARSVLRAKKTLASGRWGKITALHGFQLSSPGRRLPHWYEDLPLGLFFDESPHLLYLLRAFGGSLKMNRASMIPSTIDKVTPALIQVELDAGGLPASLFMNFEAPISEWQMMVLTEKGAAVIDIFRDILVFIPSDGLHGAKDVVRSSLAMVQGHLTGFFQSGLRMITGRLLYGNEEVVRRFLDAVENKSPLQDIDGQSGLEVLKLQHGILSQLQSNGKHS